MALTTVPAAGAKVRGATLTALMSERTPTHARMTSNQALATANIILQNITDLVIPLEANAVYVVTVDVVSQVAAGTTEDVKYGATWPAGATVDIHSSGGATTMAAGTVAADMKVIFQGSATSGTTAIDLGTTSSNTTARLRFYVATSSTAGDLQLMAAQNTSGATVVTVVAGSMMTAIRVG